MVLFVYMEVPNQEVTEQYDIVDKAVLYEGTGQQIIASSELAYSSHDMLLLEGDLQFGINSEFETQLIVYQFNTTSQQKSHPYSFTFQRPQ